MFVVIIRFLIVGPVAGALGFILSDQLLDASGVSVSSLAHPGSLVLVPVLWLYGLVLAYPLGLIPAALSALAFLKIRRSSNSILHQRLIASVVGFCFALLLGLAFFFTSSSPHNVASLLSWGTAGLFGSLVSALVCPMAPVTSAASTNVA
jgi:hypothetical protein